MTRRSYSTGLADELPGLSVYRTQHLGIFIDFSESNEQNGPGT